MSQNIAEAFGLTLKQARKAARYTQEYLAHKSGLDRTYLSMLERGLRTPSLKTVMALAQAMDIDTLVFVNSFLQVYDNEKPDVHSEAAEA